MRKWITGTAIACTILTTATFPVAAKHSFEGVRFRNWIAYCGQQIPWQDILKPDYMPDISIPEIEIPEIEIPEADTSIPETETLPNTQDSTYAKQVLDLVNVERANHGLSSLVLDESLSAVALAHSKDMAERNYFSHTTPEGKSPFDRMKEFGISYSAAAENIAAGQKTPEQVVQGWMNSEGHRRNILNGAYNKMGLGYYETQGGYGTYWTQLFTN